MHFIVEKTALYVVHRRSDGKWKASVTSIQCDLRPKAIASSNALLTLMISPLDGSTPVRSQPQCSPRPNALPTQCYLHPNAIQTPMLSSFECHLRLIPNPNAIPASRTPTRVLRPLCSPHRSPRSARRIIAFPTIAFPADGASA